MSAQTGRKAYINSLLTIKVGDKEVPQLWFTRKEVLALLLKELQCPVHPPVSR